MKAYKGFDKDLTCKKFKYEIGKEYSVPPEQVKLCEIGFHSCENPFDVLRYYKLIGSRFCEVEISGKTERKEKEDSKICSEKIKVVNEISLKDFINLSVRFLFEKCKTSPNANSGYCGQAAASGYCGQAAASGDYGQAAASGYSGQAAASGYSGQAAASGNYGQAAASGYHGQAAASGDSGQAAASGDSGQAAASGDSGQAAASGNYGQAAASGYCGQAAASGDKSVAVSTGYAGRAMAAKGNWIVLAERQDDWIIKTVKAFRVDGKKIKADTLYMLKNGKPVVVK